MFTRLAVLMLWRALALTCLVLGIAGAFLPVLPTTPFLLVTAWAGGKGWPRLEAWLISHSRWGPPIQRWRDHRAVPRSAKWAASVTMLASTAALSLSAAPVELKFVIPALMAVVAWWLWTRPEA